MATSIEGVRWSGFRAAIAVGGASLGWAVTEGVNAWVIVGTIAAVIAAVDALCRAAVVPWYRKTEWYRNRFIIGTVEQGGAATISDLINIPPGKSTCRLLIRPRKSIALLSINIRFIEPDGSDTLPTVMRVWEFVVRPSHDQSVPDMRPRKAPPGAGASLTIPAGTTWVMSSATGVYLNVNIEAYRKWRGRLSVRVTARDSGLHYFVRFPALTERRPESWSSV